MYADHETVIVGENQYGLVAPQTGKVEPLALVTAGRRSLILGIYDQTAGVAALANLNRFTLFDFASDLFRAHLAMYLGELESRSPVIEAFNWRSSETHTYIKNGNSQSHNIGQERRFFIDVLKTTLEVNNIQPTIILQEKLLTACYVDTNGVTSVPIERIGFKNLRQIRTPEIEAIGLEDSEGQRAKDFGEIRFAHVPEVLII